MTHIAVLFSLIRYGLIVIGSCLPPDLMAHLETRVVNTAARRIEGMDNPTRIEAPYFLAGFALHHALRRLD